MNAKVLKLASYQKLLNDSRPDEYFSEQGWKKDIWPQLCLTHRYDISFQTLQHNNKRSCCTIASLLDLWSFFLLGKNTFLHVIERKEAGEKNPDHSFRALHPSVCFSCSSSHPFMRNAVCTTPAPHFSPQKKKKAAACGEDVYTGGACANVLGSAVITIHYARLRKRHIAQRHDSLPSLRRKIEVLARLLTPACSLSLSLSASVVSLFFPLCN